MGVVARFDRNANHPSPLSRQTAADTRLMRTPAIARMLNSRTRKSSFLLKNLSPKRENRLFIRGYLTRLHYSPGRPGNPDGNLESIYWFLSPLYSI